MSERDQTKINDAMKEFLKEYATMTDDIDILIENAPMTFRTSMAHRRCWLEDKNGESAIEFFFSGPTPPIAPVLPHVMAVAKIVCKAINNLAGK